MSLKMNINGNKGMYYQHKSNKYIHIYANKFSIPTDDYYLFFSILSFFENLICKFNINHQSVR